MANEDKKDFNAMLHDSTEKSKRLQIFTYLISNWLPYREKGCDNGKMGLI